MKLRDYQQDIYNQLINSTSNDLVQLDTGAGKTPIEAALAEKSEYCLLIAHRNILITQISEKLAVFSIKHDTVSTEYTRRCCISSHKKYHENFIDRGNSHHLVCSIDSLIAHYKRNRLKINTQLKWLIIIDEAHHVVTGNKWGKLKEIFPNSRILGFTATPARMDGESLHVKNGGLFDKLIQANELKENSAIKLIEKNYLSNFRVYAPKDKKQHYNHGEIILYGDPVKTYKKLALGKSAIMMCPSIKNAEEFSKEFKTNGVSATCISSNNSSTEVSRALDAFISGQVKVICNVDMLTEGFDVPGIECLIIANRTGSLVRYRQWVGRSLRPMAEKVAIIIDHVGIICGEKGHGMPDDHIEWDIEHPPKQIKSVRHAPCDDCGLYYEIKLLECPECGLKNRLHSRGEIGNFYVDITRIDMDLIEKLRIEKVKIDYEKKLETEIIFPYTGDCGTIGIAVEKLRKWFVDCLIIDSIPIIKINEFLDSSQSQHHEFWLENFTIHDLKTNPIDKQRKVYKKWLKSQ